MPLSQIHYRQYFNSSKIFPAKHKKPKNKMLTLVFELFTLQYPHIVIIMLTHQEAMMRFSPEDIYK